MKDRLLHLLSKLNLSATKLADEITVQRSGISHILSGRNQPSYDFLVKILSRYPQIDPEWLILGKGNAFREAGKDEELLLKSETVQGYGKPKEKNLFNQDQLEGLSSGLHKSTEKKVTNVTYVTRIILLYSDGGYEIFDQPKKG
jgi:transcriptional regulator with XRE-family HTH domain